jgi:uncharacterized protein (TIGR02145 family)
MNLRYALSLAFVMLSVLAACSDESNPVIKDTTLSSSSIVQNPSSSNEEPTVLSSGSVENTIATFIEPCKTADADNCEYDSLVDDRNGQTYKTVKIGNLWWTAENINYKTEGSFCYGDDESNCVKYGRLYKWNGAMMACPNGWRLPTKIEFDDLFVIVGGRLSAGQVLKSTSGWKYDGNGRDAYGFSAIPAGYWDEHDSYGLEGSHAYFWSSTVYEYSDQSAYNMCLNYSAEHRYPDGSYDEAHLDSNYKRRGLSVRCVKD